MSKLNDITSTRNENPVKLTLNEEITITLRKDEERTVEITNPNGAQVLCTIETGKGDISLYKNNVRKLENTYTMSTEPGCPITVRLNTNLTSPEEDVERVNTIIALDKDKLSTQYRVNKKKITEKYLRRKLARAYAVPEASIEIQTSPRSNKKKLLIPDSIWAVLFQNYESEESRFKVKLVPKEK